MPENYGFGLASLLPLDVDRVDLRFPDEDDPNILELGFSGAFDVDAIRGALPESLGSNIEPTIRVGNGENGDVPEQQSGLVAGAVKSTNPIVARCRVHEPIPSPGPPATNLRSTREKSCISAEIGACLGEDPPKSRMQAPLATNIATLNRSAPCGIAPTEIRNPRNPSEQLSASNCAQNTEN